MRAGAETGETFADMGRLKWIAGRNERENGGDADMSVATGNVSEHVWEC